MTVPTFGSLFAGIGGFDLALERAGMRCAFQVEIDPQCRRVLAEHWPDVPRFDDIRTVHSGRQPFDEYHRQHCRDCLPAVDVLCGGFPCQDVSVAGCRAGLNGERSGLWWEFHRIASELRPAWVLIENVPSLLSSNEGRDFAAILSGLVDLGYGVAWRILDAQFFGLAQRRRRVFVVGHRGTPWSAAASVLFEPEGCGGDPPPRRETGPGTTADAEAGSSLSLSENQRAEVRMTEVAWPLTTGGGKPGQGYPAVVSTLQGGGKRGHRVDAETAAGGGLVVS